MRTNGWLALLCLLSLSGCATPRPWTKPGFTQQEWTKDSEACRREASRTVFAGKKRYLLLHAPDFYTACLEGKGYMQE